MKKIKKIHKKISFIYKIINIKIPFLTLINSNKHYLYK